jgi:aspartyl-tRNA(Asn)/glutamyl-tRNA(Gln) amidotransferase subunit B
VAAIETAVRQVMDANADAVAQYRAGKTKTFGFLVGQVLKATKGKASPERVNELMRRLLDSAQ